MYREQVLLKCIHLLTMTNGLDVAVDAFLNELGTYCEADRAYIFEYSKDGLKVSNTFEWCAEGMQAQKDILQNLDAQMFESWNRLFYEQGEFIISLLSAENEKSTEARQLLEMLGVNSLMAAPLLMNDKIVGFLGVDNPNLHESNMELMRAISKFVVVELNKRRMLRKLNKLSYTDMLTGVQNRNSYIRDLTAYYERPPQSLGVISIDVNNIKKLNERYGHRYGDKVIIRTAEILTKILPQTVYRIGGDEFIAHCPDIAKADFDALCVKLREAFAHEHGFSISIGCSWKDEEVNVDRQIIHADELMAAEKELKYYDAILDDMTFDRHNQTVKLMNEIKQGRFLVYYQPQVDICTGKIVGAEALVRKTDETGRLIPPDRFISLYEVQSLMLHIDLFVLESVLKMLSQWHGAEKPVISVNFSRSTLLMPDFAGNIKRLFQRYSVPYDKVIFEVTERAVKIGEGSLEELIPNIRAQGFKISLDDFGMEYSNLSLLAMIGVDEVKLDRSLVRDICVNKRSRIVVESIIDMCRRLGDITVVAEGIETETQRKLLARFGCIHGQGWLFYRPMPQKDFVEAVNHNSLLPENVHGMKAQGM